VNEKQKGLKRRKNGLSFLDRVAAAFVLK